MVLQDIDKQVKKCNACDLCKTRINTVFGTGNPHADIMFVGEAPGRNEDETGIPFVGAAGHLLDDYLKAVGLSRADVYIANIIKCRPPNNRDPRLDEEDCCIHFLENQIYLIGCMDFLSIYTSYSNFLYLQYRLLKYHFLRDIQYFH